MDPSIIRKAIIDQNKSDFSPKIPSAKILDLYAKSLSYRTEIGHFAPLDVFSSNVVFFETLGIV